MEQEKEKCYKSVESLKIKDYFCPDDNETLCQIVKIEKPSHASRHAKHSFAKYKLTVTKDNDDQTRVVYICPRMEVRVEPTSS